MNREIKFRAWEYSFHPEHPNPVPNMIDWGYLSTWDFNSMLKYRGNGLTLMQYTGLKDKDKKEIYEGDILLMFGTLNIVQYYLGAFGYWISKGERYESFISFHSNAHNISYDEISVCGNIYENPELINH
jgi:uncharacterized phage protein (TIGR01671 family)